jgi:hypothetical protein
MKLKFRLPRSWYTAPPPDTRRTTCTPRSATTSASISSIVFWLRPMMIARAFT